MPSTFTHPPIAHSLAAKDLPRLLNSTLRHLAWTDIFIDTTLCTLTANQKLDQQTLGKQWTYKFHLACTWTSTELTITITESNHAWSQHLCRHKSTELADALFLQPAPHANATTRGAHFSTPEELSSTSYIAPAHALAASEFLVAPAPSDQIIRVPTRDTHRHALICGPTGSGKTTGIFIPNLIERTQSSAIVTEATGGNGIADLYSRTAGFRHAAGHQIFYFNPDDLHSHQINPLDAVHTYRHARRACEIIFQSTTLRTHRGDQSWEMAERQLLTALILHAITRRKEGLCHFAFINSLLDEGAKGLNTTFSSSPMPEARRSYFRFIRTCTEGYRNLVINGLMTRLDAWNSPRIRTLTERTTIPFDSLTEHLFTLYLAVPADNAELKPMMSLILNFILDTVQRRHFTHPLMLMLDEFTNFGTVRNLPAKLTILRHDGIPATLGIQDYVQLENAYDKDAKLLISQPATRIFFKPNDIDTAEKLSKMLGEHTREWQSLTSTGQLHDREKTSSLLSPSDLLTLGLSDTTHSTNATTDRTSANHSAGTTNPTAPPNTGPTMLVFLPNTHPIKTTAYTWRDYEYFTNPANFPIPPIPAISVDESLSVDVDSDEPPVPANHQEPLEDTPEEFTDQAPDDEVTKSRSGDETLYDQF